MASCLAIVAYKPIAYVYAISGGPPVAIIVRSPPPHNETAKRVVWDKVERCAGRALLDYTHGKGADLLVMGAYGRGQVMSFLGLGGATGKVISSCRVPLLLAH